MTLNNDFLPVAVGRRLLVVRNRWTAVAGN
jgi:hypothetical protein